VPIKLPVDDKITIRWLIDHLPVRIWTAGIVAIASLVGTGFGVAVAVRPECSVSEIDALRDKSDSLKSEVSNLEAQRYSLRAQLNALQAQKEVAGMTDAQVRDTLRREGWERK
jgi:outer membrane murein-binding lipoprotein Lpp